MESETKRAWSGLKRLIFLLVLFTLFPPFQAHAQCTGSPQPGASCHGYILSSADISNPTAQCSDMSPKLVELLNCMEGYLPEKAKVISSVSDSQGMDRCIPSEHSRPPCAHVIYSCHYGGRDCIGQSYAVDFKNSECYAEIRQALAYCGGGRIKTYSTHIHVSVGCENGCNCDCGLTKVNPVTPEFNAVAKVGKTATSIEEKNVIVKVGDMVYFDASDSVGVGSFSWDYADGNTATGASPSHSFSSEGTYTVALTFTGSGADAGKSDTDTVEVGVVDFKAIAYVGKTSTSSSIVIATTASLSLRGSGILSWRDMVFSLQGPPNQLGAQLIGTFFTLKTPLMTYVLREEAIQWNKQRLPHWLSPSSLLPRWRSWLSGILQVHQPFG